MTKEVFKVKPNNPCPWLISQRLIQKRYAELATKFTRDVIVPQAAVYDRTMVRLYGYRSNLKLIQAGVTGVSLAHPQRSPLIGPAQYPYPRSCRSASRVRGLCITLMPVISMEGLS